MWYATLPRAVIGLAFLVFLQIAPVQAQFLRYVLPQLGNDVGTCQGQPTACRTLQYAHDLSSSGDKIIVLDSGGLPSVTITKSIAIVAKGVDASSYNGTISNTITINAGPNDVIFLDGLALGNNSPNNGSTSGIQFNSGGRLYVRNCVIRGFGNAGIYVRGGGAKRVFISDCAIANNFHGVLVKPAEAGGSRVQLDRVRIEGNIGHGIRAVGSGAILRISNSTIANNTRGLSVANNGKVVSFGNNAIIDNNSNGEPTSTIALK